MNASLSQLRRLRWLWVACFALGFAKQARAQAAECFPDCRSGFVCHQRRCVSLCNPVCGEGERCSANGECESVAPRSSQPTAPPEIPPPSSATPADPSVPSVASPIAPAPQPRPVVAPTALEEPTSPSPRKLWVLGFHVGVGLTGAGHSETCEKALGQSCATKTTSDFDEKSPLQLSVDGLYHVSTGLRLGANFSLIPYASIRAENDAENLHLGVEQALNGVIEGLVPLRPNWALALRAQLGARMLLVGGDLADRRESLLATCQLAGAHCVADPGPFFGVTGGTTAGLVMGQHTRWRVDLAFERSFVGVSDMSLTAAGATATASVTLYVSRLWLLAGVEL